jgi:hypothetical protein
MAAGRQTRRDRLTPNSDCPARPLAAFGARSPVAAEPGMSQIRHPNDARITEVIKGRNGKPCPAQHAPAHGRSQPALPGWNGPLETGQVIWPHLAALSMRGIEPTRR